MDEQQTPRAAGYARALALFVLLAGVIIMHSGAFAPSGGGHHGATEPASTHTATHGRSASGFGQLVAPSPGIAAPATVPASDDPAAHRTHPDRSRQTASGDHVVLGAGAFATSSSASPCTSGDCTPNIAGSHGCVFVLTALALTLVLAALYWVGWTRPGCTASRPRWWRARRARPPPWTVLTLAELAILRI
ncbi:hypothetical protein [Nocardia sp. CC227C]|uniref:hypothetical protein n=1 Tax=Nocardia sp. CC227C TaxID=3044562 RepID=UPI00278C3E2E|nr:hypothetical protein [Nocardia sp. CC227C]